jgi:hypothetical protein
MTVHFYAITSSAIFFVVAVLHLVRVLFQWDVMIGPWHFPIWGSAVGALVAGFLSYAGFRLAQTQRFSLFR